MNEEELRRECNRHGIIYPDGWVTLKATMLSIISTIVRTANRLEELERRINRQEGKE